MSAIACGARWKRESRSTSASAESWVSFAGPTVRSRASSMRCAASGRRWPRPSGALWACWGNSTDRSPTSRTARRPPSLSPPAPERRRPTTRHAIFFDVENTSHPAHIERVIERLAIDHLGRSTEFVAVGNWRVIGHETARLLARRGAQLVHSTPSTGVRDWSDLRIAVSAGVWLAGAHPGDVLEIVSDDRAFDAVGDVATALGITFHRLTARTLGGAASAEPSRAAPAAERGPRRGRRGRRGGRAPAAGAEARRAEPVRQEPERDHVEEAHTAPHDELVLVVRELASRTTNGAVLIDNVARTLKARGFSRPPGSPRLVTRLRRIQELSVSPTGMISLAPGAPAVELAPPTAVDEPVEAAAPAPKRSRRRSRRGGRGRRRTTPAAGS